MSNDKDINNINNNAEKELIDPSRQKDMGGSKHRNLSQNVFLIIILIITLLQMSELLKILDVLKKIDSNLR